MNAQAAVNCAKHAGFDMWYDRHTRLWVIQELDDPLCNKPAQYIASRPLRDITSDMFHERYLVKGASNAELDAYRNSNQY